MALAAGALASDGPILGDVAPHHEIDDLAALRDFLRRDGRQVAPARALPAQWDRDRPLGGIDQAAGRARVVFLPARLLAAGLAQRARRRFLERRVRGGRFAGVVAVLGQTRLQLLDALPQLLNLRRLLYR
nr:hypothetical protein [uncultured Lamprocystis sp.]